MRAPVLLVGLALAASVEAARADRFEASLGVDARGGLARVRDSDAAAVWTPAVGLDVRATYATRNALAYGVSLGGLFALPAVFPDAAREINGRVERGRAERYAVTTRALGGAELRLGARVIPTVRVAVGPGLRYRSPSDLGAIVGAIDAEISVDAVASVGVGLDLRLGRRRVVGLTLGYELTQPVGGTADTLHMFTVAASVSHYWYPRWDAPAW